MADRPQASKKTSASSSQPSQNQPIQEIKQKWWKDPTIISTIIIAIATVANVGVSYFMWSIAKNQLKLSQETLLATKRPYVGIKDALSTIEAGKILRINFGFLNFGNSPANKFLDSCILANG